ncbi:MSCRAMM family protein [Listeria fleischmannii]|uniref:MSCRAMM family protein n=1 Tax=Listeria fleischmannii TaxID=1069827 RepID=UPI0002B91891|nr:SpaA isopeptide-forming pilin-related protein [Listeria fleischmannii]EMG28684.1 cell wall anchoring protein [Listeria fleischmannii subsp. fleischmannii LU2006-1]
MLTKVDKDDQKTVLSGAEFKLLDANGKEIETNLVTNEDGEIMVKDLAPGKYAFVETKAPKGYKLDETPVEFTIEKEQVEMIKVMKVNKKDSSNETDNDKDYGNGNGNNTNNNGDNNSNSKLPSTGDVTILLTILVGGFLIYLGSKELKKKQAK